MTVSLRAARRVSTLAAGALLCAALVGCGPVENDAGSSAKGTAQTQEVTGETQLPAGFSYLDEAAPGISVDARYGTTDNFTGSVVDGYAGPDVAILKDEAAAALAAAQDELADQGLGLLVWDAYRPTKAVDYFVKWSENADESTKSEYYPAHEKVDLFTLGYIAKQSRHSLGGTVDLTIIEDTSQEPLDMGGPFDFFGELSNYDVEGLTEEQSANRALLRDTMMSQGFEPYPLEWWHFSFPLPEGTKPSNFPVE